VAETTTSSYGVNRRPREANNRMARELRSKQSACDARLRRPPSSRPQSCKNKRPASSYEPAGRPVVCLGLTKRWSLYVASHGNSRVRA